MKKILIIADGIVAKHFLRRISETFVATNAYTVVTLDRAVLPEKLPSNFTVYEFDPTSYIKLSRILKRDFNDIFIILKNRVDAEGTYRNIRRDDPMVRITYFNRWESPTPADDENLIAVEANEILAGRLYDFLPNVPVVAQNVGLGQGEIMEVLVPFGSAYVYRHIRTITQDRWRIVALYRSGQLLLARPDLMIKPNDVLLLVGKPAVLESVFKVIKREHGQFPAPFGENLYLFVDMACQSSKNIRRLLEQVCHLHRRIKGRRLVVRVVNPADARTLGAIKAVDGERTDVVVDYKNTPLQTVVSEDLERYNVGLVICDRTLFDRKDYRRMFYFTAKPVLSLSPAPLTELQKVVLILSDSREMEVISSTLFDVASQLDLDVELFDYELDGDAERKRFYVSHFENLAEIFSKTLHVRRQNKNPVLTLKKEPPFLQVLPFGEKMLRGRLFSYFSTDAEKLYFKLSHNPQLFVPVEPEGEGQSAF